MSNIEEHYEEIPFILLERAGFPTNSAWLSDDQRHLLEYIFNERYKLLEVKISQAKEYIEELEDEQRFLEDKVADLRHELKNLAGEK
tara:strand:+ start:1749 stop:2009 length:261 start_codon:yes stop_codon:yes gene_type:complete